MKNHKFKRCPTGSKRNKKTGLCHPKKKKFLKMLTYKKIKRCPNGSRKNRKTKICQSYKKKM
jgi:hypothetical protein